MLQQFLKNLILNFLSKAQQKIIKMEHLMRHLKRVAEKYDDIMNIILPTLRLERRKTYCPFLPLCPETGKVLEVPMLNWKKILVKLILIIMVKKFKPIFIMEIANCSGKLIGQ